MKKRNFRFALLAVIGAATTVATIVSTVAWFKSSAKVEPTEFIGSSEGAYFAYGTGTEDDPFGIRLPRHLYNLSWLNMRAYFEGKDIDGDGNSNDTFYFELAPDLPNGTLDCDGLVIPPIGTIEHPFYGNFNGNGNVITNVVITNNKSEFERKPYNTDDFWVDPEIVGLFGVVGPADNSPAYTYTSSTNKISNLGISGITVKTNTQKSLIGMAAGYVNGKLENVAVDASTINVSANTTTALTTYTSNLSDYGVVGYCEDDFKQQITQVDENIYDITMGANAEFSATEAGNTDGWGGSINMMAMYRRIYNIKKYSIASRVNNFAYRTTNRYLDGVVQTTNSDTNNYTLRYSGGLVGNFNIYDRSGQEGNTGYDIYNYLLGGHFESNTYDMSYNHTGRPITDGTHYFAYDGQTVSNVNNANSATLWEYEAYDEENNIYYIKTTYNGIEYYINNNNGSMNFVSSPSASSRWTVTLNGTNMSLVNNSYKIAYYNNVWCIIPSQDQQVTYYTISYDYSDWWSNTTYYISSSSVSGDTPASTDDLNSAARFAVDSNNNVYTTNTSERLYLAGYRSNNSRYIRMINAKNVTNYYYFTYNGSNLSVVMPRNNGGTRTYYAYCDDGDWSLSQTEIATMTSHTDYEYYSSSTLYNNFTSTVINRTGPDYYTSQTESKMFYTAEDTTYFPLNVANDGGNYTSTQQVRNAINAGNYNPVDTNTGYVISGSIIGANSTYNSGAASIRVSSYAKNNASNNISNSFKYSGTSGYTSCTIADSNVRTIDANGSDVTLSSSLLSGFTKYEDSKASLLTILRSDANNYGLHFVSSTTTNIQISKDSVVKANNISINGDSFNNYELPVNSIDFHLKEKGVINFFAGSYYNGDVSCFFSLHQVLRNDDTTIKDIKEIANVYGVPSKNNYSYIYEYKDGKYSKPFRFTGSGDKYELSADDSGVVPFTPNYDMTSTQFNQYVSTYGFTKLFNTDRITNYKNVNGNPTRIIQTLNQNYLYYFEIPMNEGEFCLGSVRGGDGGYLLYLDIAANASKTQRTTIYEHFSITRKTYSHPLGIALIGGTDVAAVTDESGLKQLKIDDTDTVRVYIPTGYTGEYFADREGTDVALTRNGTTALPTYVGLDITLVHDSGSTNPLTPVAESTIAQDIRRLTYYDYNVNLGELVKTVFTDISTDGGTTYTRTVKQYSVNTTTWVETEITENIKIYNTTTGIRYSDSEYMNQNTVKSYTSGQSTTVILEIKYNEMPGVTSECEVKLNVVIDDNNTTGTYYIFDNYVLNITSTGGDIVIKVVKLGNRTISIGTTPITAVGQEITITAS